MKVRVGQVLVYHPNLLDRVDGRTGLQSGDLVKVINLNGAPKANTMGHCYVGRVEDGHFVGLVHTNSLHTKAEYADYLRREITNARLEYLRGELRAERISYAELSELQSLVPYIGSDDVELLEAAGVEE